MARPTIAAVSLPGGVATSVGRETDADSIVVMGAILAV
ncbi:MAG: hypothetical protein KatS3mg060_0945 [Dehalococcoidia bacterium]|nr:MAG: hypothetical protein KatS3mg060_0945 [Dehalococcoidia bacterium]